MARPQEHPAHGQVHRAGAGQVQKLLARLGSRFPFDLRNSLAYGDSIEEVAAFLCRSGMVEEVRRKAEELGLLRSK
jgi:hypothetical protein